MMNGYATSTCAAMLTIDDNAVRMLVSRAILQLHHAVIAQTAQEVGRALEV
jgi:hypothetical protein